MSNKNTASIWNLIKYIIDWFFRRRKQKKQDKQKNIKEINKELQKQYKQIDEITNKQRKKNVQDRLNNMFD